MVAVIASVLGAIVAGFIGLIFYRLKGSRRLKIRATISGNDIVIRAENKGRQSASVHRVGIIVPYRRRLRLRGFDSREVRYVWDFEANPRTQMIVHEIDEAKPCQISPDDSSKVWRLHWPPHGRVEYINKRGDLIYTASRRIDKSELRAAVESRRIKVVKVKKSGAR